MLLKELIPGLVLKCRVLVRSSHLPYILCCQAVAKVLYKSYTVPPRRHCIFVMSLPWGHVNTPVEFVVLKRWDTHRQEASTIATSLRIYNTYSMAVVCLGASSRKFVIIPCPKMSKDKCKHLHYHNRFVISPDPAFLSERLVDNTCTASLSKFVIVVVITCLANQDLIIT